MIKVAITGNIASGKSSVQNLLEDMGYTVLDTDIVGHGLLSKENFELVRAFMEEDVFDENGNFDRKKLGELVFNVPQKLEKLNTIVHPQIRKEIEKFCEKNRGKDVVFVGIPLLFEAGMENMFDKIVLVKTSDELRLKRLMERNGYTTEYAQKRMESQMSQENKVRLSDYVIENDGTFQELERKTADILRKILNREGGENVEKF